MRSLVALAITLAITSSAQAKTITYAIAIGNNAPPPDVAGLATLRFADDDSVRYYEFFSRFASESRLLAVLDRDTQRRYPGMAARAEAPTLENLMRTVHEYRQKMEADRTRGDEPVFYLAFSGHGVESEKLGAYLVLADGALTQRLLFDQVLAKLPTQYSHLIVDACHAGQVVGTRGLFDHEVDGKTVKTAPSEITNLVESRGVGRFANVGVLFATTTGQEAHEWSRYESGVFTHELLSGLSGAADVNGDKAIEYTEIQAFVAAANRNISDAKAVPVVVARAPEVNRNAAIVSLDAFRNATVLRGNAARFGAFDIELANGERLIDAHLASDMVASFVLPSGGVAYLQTASEEAALKLDGQPIDLDQVKLRPRTLAARGSLDATYRVALFSAPFGATYYRGYVDSIGAIGVVNWPAPEAAPLAYRDIPTPHPARKPIAIALVSTGAALAVVSIATGIVAAEAKSDFDSTTLQRTAIADNDRYQTYLGAAIATGVLSVASGVTGAILWPKARVNVSLIATPRDYGFGLQGYW